MVGYAINRYDVEALSRGVAAEADTIGRHLPDVRASEVIGSDLGGGQGERTGTGYVDVVHGVLGDSLVALHSAIERFAATLSATSEEYARMDDDAGTTRFRQS